VAARVQCRGLMMPCLFARAAVAVLAAATVQVTVMAPHLSEGKLAATLLYLFLKILVGIFMNIEQILVVWGLKCDWFVPTGEQPWLYGESAIMRGCRMSTLQRGRP